ncbi:MAG: Methionine transporter permease protein [Evtepia sp.]|jgi:D-methionine transport system permease protein|nr:Methionine transporter permease protein [Evtepia sp.]
MPDFLMQILSEDMFKVLPTIPKELFETLYSTVLSTLFAYIIGLPLGIVLVVGEKNGILQLPQWLMSIINFLVNILRSVPFLILMIIVLPLSRMIVGTQIGTVASLFPLVIAAAPFVARMVESSLREIDKGVIEAAQAMGCSPWEIITKVMLPESRPSLISGATIALTTILGYGAMAGAIGGGGLGKVAINYGLYRFQFDVMIFAVILLVILVQIFQSIGTWLAVRCDKRITKTKKGR